VTHGSFPEAETDPGLSHEHREIRFFSAREIDELNIPDGYRRSVATWIERARYAE
jgi:hypothetical protein